MFVAGRLLRPDAEWRLEVAGRRPYGDPVLLEDRCSYITFIHSLRARNMLRFRRRRLGHAGIFFVKKKNGGLRLIVDGRIGNCILAPPPKVHLASSGTFAELRVDSADPFFLSALDVENAFHNYEIPEWLSELYGLNAVTAGEMDITSLDGVPLPPDTKIYPCMKSLPMGCSWAVEWCQDSHMELLLASGALGPSQVLTDFRPPARINKDSTVGTNTVPRQRDLHIAVTWSRGRC